VWYSVCVELEVDIFGRVENPPSHSLSGGCLGLYYSNNYNSKELQNFKRNIRDECRKMNQLMKQYEGRLPHTFEVRLKSIELKLESLTLSKPKH